MDVAQARGDRLRDRTSAGMRAVQGDREASISGERVGGLTPSGEGGGDLEMALFPSGGRGGSSVDEEPRRRDVGVPRRRSSHCPSPRVVLKDSLSLSLSLSLSFFLILLRTAFEGIFPQAPTAVGYPSTASGYPPTASGYPPTAVGYPPTASGYPPTAVSIRGFSTA